MTHPTTSRLGSVPSGQPLVRLRGPADLVQALPYLVGFRPVDSVVVVALAGRRQRLVMTARADLDDQSAVALSAVWKSAVRQGATSILLSVHDDGAGPGPLPWCDLVATLKTDAVTAGLEVLDAICVGASRFWSYECTSPGCCPAEGRPVETHGEVAAELVLQGVPTVGRREDLEREVAQDADRAGRVAGLLPDPGCHPELLPGSPLARQAAGEAMLDQLVRSAALPVDDATTAEALVALADVRVRDTQLRRRTRPEAERAVALWADLARAAPAGWRAAPLTMLAVAEYAFGNGARANVALDAALSDQPGYTLAGLLEQGIAAALPPEGLIEVLDEGARETRRAFREGLRPRRRRQRGEH